MGELVGGACFRSVEVKIFGKADRSMEPWMRRPARVVSLLLRRLCRASMIQYVVGGRLNKALVRPFDRGVGCECGMRGATGFGAGRQMTLNLLLCQFRLNCLVQLWR